MQLDLANAHACLVEDAAEYGQRIGADASLCPGPRSLGAEPAPVGDHGRSSACVSLNMERSASERGGADIVDHGGFRPPPASQSPTHSLASLR
jgi:hypothetical protein